MDNNISAGSLQYLLSANLSAQMYDAACVSALMDDTYVTILIRKGRLQAEQNFVQHFDIHYICMLLSKIALAHIVEPKWFHSYEGYVTSAHCNNRTRGSVVNVVCQLCKVKFHQFL